ncbi:T9SS type A sorting domain-containing protein [candidate division WOR-3 bacterium]|nr:T9SS type A sorting domain-containing protein [candidate division WOR-3 bacterium]
MGLNPEKQYQIEVTYYHESEDTLISWVEMLKVDGIPLGATPVRPGKPKTITRLIPIWKYQDGEIEVRIKKIIGDYAVVSAIYIYEYEGVHHGGGAQTAYSNIPMVHSLSLYPNPARNDMTIKFGIPNEERVSLKVYDVSGREVKTLVDDRLEAGYHIIRLDNMNFPSGIYFARLVADRYKATKKIILVR